MRASVVVFPGSNCDRDVMDSLAEVLGITPQPVWHDDETLPEEPGLVVLPGGFSYGDYLRCGAMAARARIMKDVRRHAADGGLVLGICNGFQVLTESRLLPGAILGNRSRRFICSDCTVRVEADDTPFTSCYEKGQVLSMPIAHHEGLFFLPPDQLDELETSGQVVFRYCCPDGSLSDRCNPNGALRHIAGVRNAGGNVLGLMPHPERASESILGSQDGAPMWRSVAKWMNGGVSS